NSPIKTVHHSFEAEQAVIGFLLLDNDTWSDVSERVEDRDFYTRAHRLFFSTIEKLSSNHVPDDIVTLSEKL
ncbi:DnaB-like helicase N-terminal domain-containing protein, partial [Psychromonas aquatilis]